MKKLVAFFVSIFVFSSLSVVAFADSAPGDVISFFGENLTPVQKEQLKNEMQIPEGSAEVSVSNKEEHEYLGKYIPAATIGTKAISSGKITIGEAGSGIVVKTNHINWVSNEMYTNALITAGVKDAEIYVTAPFDVSGTAALTGITKAYEVSTGTEIPEAQKQVANQEMVTTAKLGDQIGDKNAISLLTTIKDKMAKEPPKTDGDITNIINISANELNINLTDDQKQNLLDLFKKMKNAHIDWNQVGDQLQVAKQKFDNFINSDEGKSIISKIKEFIMSIIDIIKSWFQ